MQGVFQEAGLELIVLLAAGCQRRERVDLQEPPGEGGEWRALGLPGPWGPGISWRGYTWCLGPTLNSTKVTLSIFPLEERSQGLKLFENNGHKLETPQGQVVPECGQLEGEE